MVVCAMICNQTETKISDVTTASITTTGYLIPSCVNVSHKQKPIDRAFENMNIICVT